MSNTRCGQIVRFNLLNHTKPDSLFNYGMRMVVFSERLNQSDCVGRSRYYYYTLAFTYEFEHDEDTVFFAYTTPYTYSKLSSDLSSYEKDSSVTRNSL